MQGIWWERTRVFRTPTQCSLNNAGMGWAGLELRFARIRIQCNDHWGIPLGADVRKVGFRDCSCKMRGGLKTLSGNPKPIPSC